MKLFNKKFKVRVVHFSEKYYSIEYCFYRFIPNWNSIKTWFEYGLLSELEHFGIYLMTFDNAEKLAKTFKSYNDIAEYYKPLLEKRKVFNKKKAEHISRVIPYKIKNIT